ncbi:LSU ribosomal protein L19p [Minicystis rosea]|nr:LSU ribosomal protein L19p [Minicystis rosea]
MNEEGAIVAAPGVVALDVAAIHCAPARRSSSLVVVGGDLSLFVRTRSVDTLRASIPAWIDVALGAGCAFARLSNAEDWSDLARRLSSAGADVVELGFQSTIDAFRFVRWSKGKPTRTLVFGWSEDERTWERIDGEPEPWEGVFAKPPRRGAFDTLDARETAYAVGQHYMLSGWYTAPLGAAKRKAAAKKPKAKVVAKSAEKTAKKPKAKVAAKSAKKTAKAKVAAKKAVTAKRVTKKAVTAKRATKKPAGTTTKRAGSEPKRV